MKEDWDAYKVILAVFVLLFALLITAAKCQAEENNAVFAGIVASAEPSATPTINFSGAFRKYLFGSPAGSPGAISSMTFYDISGVQLRPLNVSRAQYSGSQALTILLYRPTPWLSLWALGDAGLLGTAGVSTGARYGAGGYAEINFGKQIRGLVMPKATKNTLTGTSFETRVYMGVAF